MYVMVMPTFFKNIYLPVLTSFRSNIWSNFSKSDYKYDSN